MQPEQETTPVEAPQALDVKVENEALLLKRLKNLVTDAKTYWDGGNDAKRNLTKNRERNYNFWLGDHYKDVDLYDHNIKYTNNRIYISIEKSLRLAAAREAQIETMPGSDKAESIQLADDVKKSIQRIAKNIKLKKKIQTSGRRLLTKYVGYIEFFWNPALGRDGDIDCRVLDPDDVVISEKGDLFEEPPVIDIRRSSTAQDLVRKYPHKEHKIREKFSLLGDEDYAVDTKKRRYHEIYYDEYDDEGRKTIRIATTLGDDYSEILGVMENLNWLEENDDDGVRNFFSEQRKPIVIMNFQNSGNDRIDDNSPTDQQVHLQRIINKRGRQISENIDENSGGIVYNSKMISKTDMATLIGAPDEKIGVSGDVRMAVARMTPPLLPGYVSGDMIDARNQLDEMGATGSVNQNGQSRDKTATQAMLKTQEDYMRQDDLGEAIEATYLEAYQWITQLIKVWYSERKTITVRGEDGQFDYVMMQSDKIEDGLDMEITTGSTAPLNREQNRSDVKDFINMGIPVDPLTVFEVTQSGIMPSPLKMVERMTKWMSDKAAYYQSAQNEEIDRNAAVDIEMIKRGQPAIRREEITAEYLEGFIKYMTSGEFLELETKPGGAQVQAAMRDYLQASQERAAQVLQMRQSMEASAKKALSPIPDAVNPTMTAPTGTPPPEMMQSLLEKGLVDEQGRPTVPVAEQSPAAIAGQPPVPPQDPSQPQPAAPPAAPPMQ